MAKKRMPWFPFYVDDWLLSKSVRLMSRAQQSMYIDLLAHQWRDGSIPSDLEEIASLLHVSAEEMESAWPRISKQFEQHPEDAKVLVNPRLFEERAELHAKGETNRQAALKRWGKTAESEDPTAPELVVVNGNAVAMRTHTERTADESGDNKKATIFEVLPSEWSTDRLASSWAEFCKHRRQLGVKQYTGAGIKLLCASVLKSGMGPDDFADLIDLVITSNWQGIPHERIKNWRSVPVTSPGKGRSTRRASLAERKAQLSKGRHTEGSDAA